MANPDPAIRRSNSRRPRQPNGQYLHKLTPELVTSIASAVANGSVLRDAALLNGIAESTFHDWMANGRSGGRPLERELVAQVDKALARVKSTGLAIITAHAQKDWRAQAWILEKRFPDEFGPRVGLTVDGEVRHDHRHTLELGKLDEAELASLEAILTKAVEPGEQAGELLQLPRGSE